VLHDPLHNSVFGRYIENFIPKPMQSQILGFGGDGSEGRLKRPRGTKEPERHRAEKGRKSKSTHETDGLIFGHRPKMQKARQCFQGALATACVARGW
jgi:hypothetical protein